MVSYEICGSDVNPGDMARLKVSYAYIHRIHPNTEDNLQYVQDYVNTNKYYLVKRGGGTPFYALCRDNNIRSLGRCTEQKE